MLKDITIGQFFPGKSVIHRVDPRVKIVMVLAFIVVLFLAKGPWAYAFTIALLAAVIINSKISLRLIVKGIKPLVFIILFTAVLNMFYTPGRALWTFGIFTITYEGVIQAVYMAVRIILLIIGTSMLTYTTSPIMLTDGLESLLKPWKRFHVPVHELAMMMTIALRFIPTLIEETDKIMNAQKARGADFETGNLIQRAKALVPILIPLFVSAFRRADELAVAMECRLYHGGEGRTRLKELKMGRLDYGAIAVGSLCLLAVLLLSGRIIALF